MIETFAICLMMALLLETGAVLLWRKNRPVIRAVAVLLAIAAFPFFAVSLYLGWFLYLGQPKPEQRVLRQGVLYERLVMTIPREIVAHVVTVDLSLRPEFAVTPAVDTPKGPRNVARVPSQQMSSLSSDLLVNASFFGPFHDNHLLDYFPHEGDLVQTIGTTIGQGRRYGLDSPTWVTFWTDDRGRMGFGTPPSGATCAVSGLQWLVRAGKASQPLNSKPYPRTILGFDRGRKHLILLVVDGKQPRYSRGMTYPETQALLLKRGVWEAIELDGGGSSTLLFREASGKIVTLNRPCHTKIPWRERPIANCLGIRF